MPAQVAPPPALKDPDAMDVDHTKGSPVGRKCFKCGKVGHLVAECPLWVVAIKAAVREAMSAGGGDKAVEGVEAGFV